jgi:uncharacterized protein involved in exopolysaccharide biosynthesis
VFFKAGNLIMEENSNIEATERRAGKRTVYLMPESALAPTEGSQIDLRELWNLLWRGKVLITSVTLFFAIASVSYSLLVTEWYRAEALLIQAPGDETSKSPLFGNLGGVAALAGVSVGPGDYIEALATLRSRAFAREFIESFDLLPIFFAEEWDAENKEWISDDPEDWPDVRNGIKYFHDNVLRVREDQNTGLVSVTVDWTNRGLAASWAGALVNRLNERLRERSLRDAATNVAYLQEELAKTNVVTLQQSISRLLEGELQKLMLARGNEEYAFRIIDAPTPPKDRFRPKRALICVLGTMLGGILGIFVVFLLRAVRPEVESRAAN